MNEMQSIEIKVDCLPVYCVLANTHYTHLDNSRWETKLSETIDDKLQPEGLGYEDIVVYIRFYCIGYNSDGECSIHHGCHVYGADQFIDGGSAYEGMRAIGYQLGLDDASDMVICTEDAAAYQHFQGFAQLTV